MENLAVENLYEKLQHTSAFILRGLLAAGVDNITTTHPVMEQHGVQQVAVPSSSMIESCRQHLPWCWYLIFNCNPNPQILDRMYMLLPKLCKSL